MPVSKIIIDYFVQITKNFNYILILQILPLLFISSTLIEEINPSLFHKQMAYYTLSAIVFIIAAYMPWKYILWLFAPFAYIVNIFLLLAVDIAGKTILGAKRWLIIPGVGTIQPSEFAKLSIVLFLAFLISKYPPKERGYGLLPLLGLTLVIVIPSILILKEPDLGTTLLLLLGAFGALFVVGINWRITVTVVALLAFLVPTTYNYILKPYQKKRIEDFLGKPSYQV
ncbi:MAG TPA: rod shape-determining protein RodA, partial [Nitratifractor sp.]|nr:rod shape-determining protein RodA [Nitratifractor sp.]